VRPEILLPIIVALVFVAAFEGSHDWGDLWSLLAFGIMGWIMKRLGWPRPPLILGLVIGGIFERYLFISTELYGLAWLLRPVVIVMFGIILWVLYRPVSQIVRSIARDLATLRLAGVRLRGASAVTLAVIGLAVAALISTEGWEPAERLVPRTACAAALIAALLNLVTELFGADRPADAATHESAPAELAPVEFAPEPAPAMPTLIGRAAVYFGWLGGFIVLTALVGFVPAIALFVVGYMRLAWGEPWRRSIAASAATTLFCWAVFDRGLAMPWPPALLGDAFPSLRDATALL